MDTYTTGTWRTGGASEPGWRNSQTISKGVPAGEGKGHLEGATRYTRRGGRDRGGRPKQELSPAPPPLTRRERRPRTNRALDPPRQ